jgi:hypothetical protein
MARREEEKEQFVVSDKRKFTSEGELRPDVQRTEEAPSPPTSASVATAEPAVSAQPTADTVGSSTDEVTDEKMPPPPSAAEQKAQREEYHQAGKKIDSMLDAAGAQRPADVEMTFERLTASLYMQAMMQLGMLREENVAPQPDLIGARQTIDTIALLQEKTKGNLTDRETHMLQNCLFELRMAFLEITNMLTRPPDPAGKPGAPGNPAGGIKR